MRANLGELGKAASIANRMVYLNDQDAKGECIVNGHIFLARVTESE